MPRYILRLDDESTSPPTQYYLEWSTVVDAPVTEGMTRDEFTTYYRHEYGAQSFRDEFPVRMARVDAKGTSSIHDPDAASVLSFNRAGLRETHLSAEQIIDFYCRKRAEGEPPMGEARPGDAS